MATYPYPHSSAATYPPPIFTGGYYASPLPFYYGAPPAFPYPPPASAYAPPPGFFPTPAYGPSTFPSTATYPQPPPPSAYMTATAPAYDPSALLSTTTSSPDFPAAVTSPYSQVHAPPPESTAPPTPAPPTTGTAGSTPPSAQPWVVFSPSTGLDSVRFTPPPPAGRPATALLCCPDRGVPLLAESFSPTFSNATASSPVTSPFLGRTMTVSPTSPLSSSTLSMFSGTGAPASSSASSPSSRLSASFITPAPMAVSSTCTSASIVLAAPAHVAPQVFGEMPTPISWLGTHVTAPNYCSGHQNPIQSTYVPDGNSHLSEQSLDGISQAYGLHNLNRQSVFLADGSEHSYFALPENYPLERATPVPVFDVYVDDTEGDSNESICVLASHHGQEPYEQEERQSSQAPKCLSKPTFSPERPTVGTEGVFSSRNENESGNELLAVSFNNAANNSFSEEATDFRYPRAPAIHADRYIQFANKESTQVVSRLCVQEATMHCDDERFEINIKKQDVPINKHGITYSCDLNTEKEVPLALQYQLPLSSAPCIWDPGIDVFSYKKMHLVSWIPHSAILLLQQLHNKIISSMWEFTLGKGKQVQWDPGIELLLYELLWLQTLSNGTEYAMLHLLVVKFGTQNSTKFIDTAAIMCCPLPNLIQPRRNVAVVLHSWRSIFQDMHYRQIFQKCKAMSSQLHWHEEIKCYEIALWLITFNPP